MCSRLSKKTAKRWENFCSLILKSISCVETKPEKLLRRSLFAVASLSYCKTTLLLPTPMAVSQLYASIAQQSHQSTQSPLSQHPTRDGQTFPKSTEIRNSVAFPCGFFRFFRPCFSVVAESVSEQLLQRIGGLGGQFWLSKESVSTSATDCQISAPICTKYGLQKSVLVSLMDCISYVKYLANKYIQSRKAESIF